MMDYMMETNRAINPANSVSTSEETDEEELFDEDEDVPMQQRGGVNAAKTRRKQVKPVRIMNEKPETSSTESKMQCGFCSSQCDDLNVLKNHLYKDHIEEILNHLVSQSAQPKSNMSVQKLETFCTICKKEVCNKYFLKSHLLNKHGVQLEDYLASNTSSEPAQPSSQAALYAAAVANELIENHAQNLSLATLSSALTQRYAGGSNNFSPNNFDYFLNSSSKLIDEPSAKKDDDQTTLLNQYLSMALQPQAPTETPTSNTSCDLCQKQFCNKYYLKKHKVDVHGLEPQSAKSNHSIESVQAAATLSMLINPFLLLNNTPAPSTDSASPATVKEETDDKTALAAASVDEPAPLLSQEQPSTEAPDLACDICGKCFKNADFLNMHKLNKHKLKPLSDVQSNVLSSESFCEYCNKSFCNKYFLRTHMSKAHGKTLIIESSGQNSMLDSADDETFFASKVVDRVQCDICQKQVCNKYFLRTHKQKVHGIYDTETTASEENECGELDMSEPMGGEMHDSIEESHEVTLAEEILPSPPSTSPSTAPIIDNQNSFCNICKRKFYSYNFLRHHMNKIHGIKLAKREPLKDENEHSPRHQQNKESTPKSLLMKKLNRLPLSNSLLNLVNSFKCRLCSKDFKNKPLLKQHVQNSHKIKFSEYVAKYVHAEQSSTSLARSILLNNLFNSSPASSSPSKNFKFKNKRMDAGRKRKNSGNSVGQSSIESSVSKKSRTSSDNEINDMIKQCKSMYQNEGNLQAFMLEKDESEPDENACFMPCLVYLPVKGRINDQISVRIKLRPIKQDNE